MDRTLFAERPEEMYYLFLRIDPASLGLSFIVDFHELPTRPVVGLVTKPKVGNLEEGKNQIRRKLFKLDPDSIVRIDIAGPLGEQLQSKFDRPRAESTWTRPYEYLLAAFPQGRIGETKEFRFQRS